MLAVDLNTHIRIHRPAILWNQSGLFVVYLIGTDEKEISESLETTVAPHLEDGIMIPCDRQRGRPRGERATDRFFEWNIYL